MYGNCLANTRNLINAHLFQGREPEAQEEQAEGTEEGTGETRGCREGRHFRYIQQVLGKCLSPSPAEQKAGWEWAETPEGGWKEEVEGGGRV